ncbi:MAG: tetratricopeptide repeat protein, partial [Oligoflexia bacterium]|nr:tetratricopeptide repeat protein [Oligoflexia bacterium]
QEILTKNENMPELYLLLGKAYCELNDFERAEKNASAAINQMPDSYEARLLLDEIATKKIEYEKVQEKIKKLGTEQAEQKSGNGSKEG